jgi:hypothetical protein
MPRRSPRNSETLVASQHVLQSGNTFANKVAIRYEPDPKGSFAELQRRGLHITITRSIIRHEKERLLCLQSVRCCQYCYQ